MRCGRPWGCLCPVTVLPAGAVTLDAARERRGASARSTIAIGA
jgi:hypothetical protein